MATTTPSWASKPEKQRRDTGPVDAPQGQAQSNSGSNDINDPNLYTVDKKNETVQGQLDQYLDKDNAILNREAQKGRDAASARGLTNSSIAGGNAIGAVLDRAGEWATTDAGIYERRKNTNVGAATDKYGIDKTLEGTKYTADSASASSKYNTDSQSADNKYNTDAESVSNKYNADKGLEGDKLQADANKYVADQNLAGNRYNADKGLEGDKIRSNAQITAAGISAEASVKSSAASALATVVAAGINAKAQELSDARRSQDYANQFASQERISQLDNASRSADLANSNEYNAVQAGNSDRRQGLMNQNSAYTAAVANIDPNASPASQQTSFDRITAANEASKTAIAGMSFDPIGKPPTPRPLPQMDNSSTVFKGSNNVPINPKFANMSPADAQWHSNRVAAIDSGKLPSGWKP